MSFSNDMKIDLCRVQWAKECCLAAEFTAFAKTIGAKSDKEDSCLHLYTENVNIARRIYSMAKGLLHVSPAISVRRTKKLKERNVYYITLNFNYLINETAVLEGKIRSIVKKQCCTKAFLRGIFLSIGSVTNPNNNYHLEMVFKEEELACEIRSLLTKYDITAKMAKRKNSYILYIKDVNQISDFLNIIGAHKALIDLENIRILRDMRNSVNRIVNCETANLSKTVDASIRHIESIKFLAKVGKMDRLSPQLKEIADIRIEYPDASLKELGAMLSKPLGKSGVNHRLNKIERIANEYRNI